MNALTLCLAPSPLANATPEVKEVVSSLAFFLCLIQNIKPEQKNFVTYLGAPTDQTNLQALSTWIYFRLQDLEVENHEDAKQQLNNMLVNCLCELEGAN
jgi:hypothetical protein